MAPGNGNNNSNTNSGPKPRMGVLLRQSTSFEKSPNRSPELDALQQKYKDHLCPQLKTLRQALKQRHTALLQTAKAQASVADALSALSHDTPYADSMSHSTQAMKSVSQTTLDRRAVEFQTKVLDYVDLWQATVTTRVNNGMKNTDTLRREVDHYSTKLESLQKTGLRKNNKADQPPAPPSAQEMEKMQRNQEKYRQAQEVYQKAALEHYWVLDEVVNRSWRDLHPILDQLLQLDTALVQDSNSKDVLAKYEKTLAALQQEVEKQQQQLSQQQQQQQPDPSERFRAIANDSPQQLNTSNSNNGPRLSSPSSSSAAPPRAPPSYGSPSNNRYNNSNNNDNNVGGKVVTQTTTTIEPDGRKVTRTVTTKTTPSGGTPASAPPPPATRPQSPPKRRLWGGNNNNDNDNGGNGQRPETAPAPQRYPSNSNSGPPSSAAPASPTQKRKPMMSMPWRNSNNNNSSNQAPPPPPPVATPTKSSSSPANQRIQPSRMFNKPTNKPSPPPAAPLSPGRDGMAPRPPRAVGVKGGKVASSAVKPHPHDLDPWQGADPSKWKFLEQRFGGSFQFEEKGKSEHVVEPISKGREKFRSDPDKYLYLFFQANMLDWPTNQQRYTLIHREGSKGHVPTGISPRGPMTILTQYYERLPAFPNNELPNQYRDAYTDNMTHQRRKLHSAKNKPIMPGRGMGVGDTPSLKIIGDVDPSDIHQGSVGDCWLLSGISSLAEFDGAIKHLYRKTKNLEQRPLDGPNQYVITLWDLPTWTERDIVVDERLPVKADGSGQLLASKPSEDGEMWVCYLEKALAIHCGGWDKITGGQCTHAWALLTGCKEQYTIRINPATGKFACFGKYNTNQGKWSQLANCPHEGEQSMWRNAWPAVGGGGSADVELTQEELFIKMCAWDDANFIVGAGCSEKSGDDGLVDNHAYSVIECHNDVAGTPIDLIKVRNPWGKGEIEDGEFDDDGPGWKKWPQVKKAVNPVIADDGIFWVTKDEFFKFFSTIYFSASNMTEFLED
ncbi:hypothetical protein ACA910_003821 [Epithemia clementina (nom. ined.)]